MSFQDFMNKVRYWDNVAAKWMIRHFIILFFEFVLVIIFFFFFFNTLQFLDFVFDITRTDLTQRLLMTQTIYLGIIVVVMLLNSFWTLYLFNTLLRIQNALKDLNFYLSRQREKSQ